MSRATPRSLLGAAPRLLGRVRAPVPQPGLKRPNKKHDIESVRTIGAQYKQPIWRSP